MESWLVERGVPQSGVAAFSAQGFDSVESLVKARLGEADLRELGLEQMRLRKTVLHALGRERDAAKARRDAAKAEGAAAAAPAALGGSGGGPEAALCPPCKGTPAAAQLEEEAAERLATMTECMETILGGLGEDVAREGLVKTPHRAAQALLDLTAGYGQSVEEVVGGAVFDEEHEEMVIVRDIDIFSLCEHHMLPFYGKVHIGYVPQSKVIGLSKLARIANMYSRRLQVQERLTKQIATALDEILAPQGVAVVVEAAHMCMAMRGVCKPGSSTVTSSLRGCFLSDHRTRKEFFSMIQGRSGGGGL